MTDEELSELAEYIAGACQGRHLAPYLQHGLGSCRPLAAAIGYAHPGYPNPGYAAEFLGIPESVGYGIAHGFDGAPFNQATDEPRAYAIGQLFRHEAGW